MLATALASPATSRMKARASGFVAGAKGGTVGPSPYSRAWTGALLPMHGEVAWFERIHVLPRLRDLAFLVNEQDITVEVWNAYRAAGKVLTSITVTGAAGVSVESPPTLPLWVPATHSDIYTVVASEQGDPRIDDVVLWTFVGVDVDGTDLRLLGSRLVPLPFMANGEDPMDEGIGYKTLIHTSRDGTEQRAQTKGRHRATYELSVRCGDEREAQHLNAILYGWQSRVFGVPLWNYAERLASTLNVSGTTVVLPTTGIPWEAGDALYLWRDPWTWEALTVETPGSGQVEVTTGARLTWPAGTLAMPLAVGRLVDKSAVRWEGRDNASARLRFTMDRVTT